MYVCMCVDRHVLAHCAIMDQSSASIIPLILTVDYADLIMDRSVGVVSIHEPFYILWQNLVVQPSHCP